jgi:hypothetical protein
MYRRLNKEVNRCLRPITSRLHAAYILNKISRMFEHMCDDGVILAGFIKRLSAVWH